VESAVGGASVVFGVGGECCLSLTVGGFRVNGAGGEEGVMDFVYMHGAWCRWRCGGVTEIPGSDMLPRNAVLLNYFLFSMQFKHGDTSGMNSLSNMSSE